MRSVALALLGLALVSAVGATELTKETFDDATAGKTVFIKFLAPWWGHCKSMKPAWDKLMAEYKDDKTVLVADVDCTAGGKSLCDEVGVRGYPTIKYGDPSDLQDYKGGRSESDLKKFASGLGPSCGPAALDLCDDEKKKQIGDFTAMGAEAREAKIKEQESEIEKLESDFKEFVDGLQKQYKEKSDTKEKAQEEVKNSGLGLLKSVHVHEKKKKQEL